MSEKKEIYFSIPKKRAEMPALAVLAVAVRAVEVGEVLLPQVRRALDRHAADDHVVQLVDLHWLDHC